MSSSLSPTKPTKHTRQLVRDIQACNEDVSRALLLLGDLQDEGPCLAVLHVCGKAKNIKAALELQRKFPSSESCRAVAISVCGKCGQIQQALKLLNTGENTPSIQSYNAAIAACAHNHAWKEALQVFESMPSSLQTTFSCNSVLTAMAKCKQGTEALQLFQQAKSSAYPNIKPDRTTFHLAITALCKQNKLEAALSLLKQMKQHPDTFPKDATYEILILAHSKRKLWDVANSLEQERQDHHHDSINNNKTAVVSFDFWDMNNMTKVGRGKYARWEFGSYTFGDKQLTLAVHPHRNPGKNGISLLLVDNSTLPSKPIKIGYCIMVNSASANTSTLLGVYVDPAQRKHGFSQVFIGLWLQLCLEANITPTTGIIQKPLLALVLQHTFGCTPQPGAGVETELSAGKDNASIVLYSTAGQDLAGAFSPKDVKREGIEFIKQPARPRGRQVTICCCFSPPTDRKVLQKHIDKALAGKSGDGKLCHGLTSHEVRRVFLGEK